MVDFIRSYFFPEKRIPYVVASMLDEEHDAKVRDIWRELREELSIEHLFDNPTPHFTHIQAQNIDRDALKEALNQFAAQQAPYVIRTAGLGIFTGEHIAVYVSVVRNPALTRIQTQLIGTLAGTLEGISQHHLINSWMPHISLLIPGMGDDQLNHVIQLLARRDFTWEITIDRVTVLTEDEPITVTLEGHDDD